MIDPTREEWLAACDALAFRMSHGSRASPRALVEAALGLCPPEPAPEPFRLDAYTLVRIASPYLDKIAVPRHLLTADEAFAMAAALVKHAVYAREQEAPPGNRERPRAFAPNPGDEPICGRLLVGQGSHWDPVCQRPKGHAGFCQEGFDE